MNMLPYFKINLFYIIFITSFFYLSTPLYAQRVSPDQMQLSDEDLSFLQEAQKEVAKYVENLPTEASLRASGYSDSQIAQMDTREKFDREVERLSKMSEEELLQEIEKAISEATAAQEAPEPERPTPAPVTQKQVEAEKPKPVVSTVKQQKGIELIDAVIMAISNFMSKAQIMLELPIKMESWQKEGKLPGIPASIKWNTFKTQIEDLQAKLQRVKDKDPITNAYRYLDEFTKDETLQNNLQKMKQTLIDQEAKIVLSPLGIEKMSTQSRQSVRNVLLALHEGISSLNIPAALDKIFEKYEPTAKKIKESEEAAAKRALEQAKQKPAATRATVSGRPKTDFGPVTPTRYPSYDRGGADLFPELGRRPGFEQDKKDKAGAPGLKGPEGKAAGAPTPGKPEGAKKEDEKKAETDKKAEAAEGSFATALEAIREVYDEHSKLSQLEKHINKNTNEPVDKELPDAITNINRAVRKASSGIKSLKRRFANLSDAQKKMYRKSAKDAFKEISGDLEKIVSQVSAVQKASKPMIVAPMNPKQQLLWKAKWYNYFGPDYEADLKSSLETYVKQAKEREQKAQKAGDKKALEEATADLNFAKKIEDFTKTADLNDLRVKIVELKKAVNDL